VRPVLLSLLLVAVVMIAAIALFPHDSDAAFAVHDGIWYAEHAETYAPGSIMPHHPLFHLVVLGVLEPLRAAGVAHPGHVATRIVAGLGGAWLLLQIAALAGWRRFAVGAAFALVVLGTRGFLVEMGTGENVLPAAAAGLFALVLATRPGGTLFAIGAALVIAGLMRQDNVFVAPGVAWAVAAARPAGARLPAVLKLAAGASIATAAGYVAFWLWSRRADEGLFEWTFRLALDGSWTGPKGFEIGQLPVYVFSIALVMTGRIAAPFDLEWVIGVLYVLAFLVAGFLLRGTTPHRRLVMPVVLTLVGRAAFHSWYEANNFEWLVMPIALVAAVSAGLCHGEPATGTAARRTGIALLLGLTAWLLIAHGKWTWALRERRLMTAVVEVAGPEWRRWRFIANGARPSEALHLLGARPFAEGAPLAGTYRDLAIKGGDDAVFLANLAAELQARPVPTIVITDRFVMDGMPYTAWSEHSWGMDRPGFELPGFELVRKGSPPRTYAARFSPGTATTAGGR
jgi:hypothetical protein